MNHLTESTLKTDMAASGDAAAEKQFNALYWVVLAYFFLEYVRPQTYLPFLKVLSPALLVSLLLMFAWIAKGDKKVLREIPILMLVLFILLSAVSVLYAVNYYYVYEKTRILIIYCFAGILPMIMVMTTWDRFKKFLVVWLFMHLFIALTGIITGGHGSSSFLSDQNDLAATLNMVLPYAWFMSKSKQITTTGKMTYFILVIIVITGVIVTSSRGGFLGLVAAVMGIIFLSKNKFRNLVLLAILGGIFYMSVPDEYVADMKTITDKGNNTRVERLHSWKLGWAMFLDNPVLGVGAGNYPWNAGRYELKVDELRGMKKGRMLGGRVAHSVYFTVIPEYGLLGTSMFVTIIISLYIRMKRIIKLEKKPGINDREIDDYCLIAKAIVVSLLAFLVCGAFISIFYYPHCWYLIGFALVLESLVKKRLIYLHGESKSSLKKGSLIAK